MGGPHAIEVLPVRRSFPRARARACGLLLWLAAAMLCVPPRVAADLPGAADDDKHAERALATAQDVAGDNSDISVRTATRNALLIGGASLAVAVYGAENWWQGGFKGGFDAQREGWFGADTEFGGVDKLGHMYSNYVGVRLLTPIFEAIGNTHRTSVSLAAWSTVAIFTAVEVLDGFSYRYHFSIEDAIANVAGAALGYFAEHNRRLDDILDFRLFYRQSPYANGWDPLGDYSGQRYLLVVKADAFAPLRARGVTRYLEVAVGYGAQGYDAAPDAVVDRQRELYFGVSLNLSRVVADAFYEGRSRSTPVQRTAEFAFDVIQFPTFVYATRRLD